MFLFPGEFVNICDNSIGNEFHYLFIYPNQHNKDMKTLREKYILADFINNPNENKFINLLKFCHTVWLMFGLQVHRCV